MKRLALTPRLRSAAALVRQDAVFADIGTDHAYLPVFLLGEGRISFAYCTDINEGPLSSARKNAEAAGLLDRTAFILADGADALCGKGVLDVAICGMGGELIADIIDRAKWLRDERVQLILGPMTKQAHLRRYLYAAGFEIAEESYSTDAGKHYVTLLARFIGECRKITDTEAETGVNPYNFINKASQISYIKTKISAYRRSVEGRAAGNLDAGGEREILSSLEDLLRDLNAECTTEDNK